MLAKHSHKLAKLMEPVDYEGKRFVLELVHASIDEFKKILDFITKGALRPSDISQDLYRLSVQLEMRRLCAYIRKVVVNYNGTSDLSTWAQAFDRGEDLSPQFLTHLCSYIGHHEVSRHDENINTWTTPGNT